MGDQIRKLKIALVAVLLFGLVTVVTASVEIHLSNVVIPTRKIALEVDGGQRAANHLRRYNSPLVMDEPFDDHGEQMVQDQRLDQFDKKFDAVDKFVEATNTRISLVESEQSMQKGIVIGFGGLLGFLGTLTVLLQLKGSKKA